MDTFLRIGVIGDIHAEAARLENVLNFLGSEDLDGIFCVGDIVDGTGCPNRCCQLLLNYGVATVLGNHDQWCLDSSNRNVAHATLVGQLSDSTRQALESLPRALFFETLRGKAMVCHGLGEFNMASVRPSDSMDDIHNNLELWAIYRDKSIRFVINGHTHRPSVRTFEHLTVINAGALNIGETACCVVIDFRVPTVDFIGVNATGEIQQLVTEHLN